MDLYQQFCQRRIPVEEWTHQAHLRVAWAHLERFSEAEALARLRKGIPLLNQVHGVKNSDTSGYHETLTVFWVRILSLFRQQPGACEAEMLGRFGHRDFVLQYYSRELLGSPESRRLWCPPDLGPLTLSSAPL